MTRVLSIKNYSYMIFFFQKKKKSAEAGVWNAVNLQTPCQPSQDDLAISPTVKETVTIKEN